MLGRVLVALVLVAATSRCGIPVCAAGFGDCEEMWKNAPASTTGSTNRTSAISLVAQKKQVRQNETTELVPSGGTPPYRYRVEPADNHGAVTESGGKAFFKSDLTGTYTIFVLDASNPVNQNQTDVTVQ